MAMKMNDEDVMRLVRLVVSLSSEEGPESTKERSDAERISYQSMSPDEESALN
jgi:hypothetical protein